MLKQSSGGACGSYSVVCAGCAPKCCIWFLWFLRGQRQDDVGFAGRLKIEMGIFAMNEFAGKMSLCFSCSWTCTLAHLFFGHPV